MRGHGRRDVRLLTTAAPAQRGPTDARPCPHQLQQVDLDFGSRAHPDHHDPGTRRQVRQDSGEAGGADQFEHDVVGAVGRHFGGVDDRGRRPGARPRRGAPHRAPSPPPTRRRQPPAGHRLCRRLRPRRRPAPARPWTGGRGRRARRRRSRTPRGIPRPRPRRASRGRPAHGTPRSRPSSPARHLRRAP